MLNTLNERLKQARKNLGLSQEYVAEVMNMNRTTITSIEAGNRKVTAIELKSFSELYGVTINDLIYNEENKNETKMFARAFSSLSDIDKDEIMNLIEFKKKIKARYKVNA
ncbi:helix-turn-helix transcriptional regulator [uncultured Clostridium sp.]|uniref:helix-turn-helix transcriptional regulator n=1 Tax=uncultured Clostridium sp. TaxID=59620 RepID=UPI00261D63A5|nr:helix-turn-helix transcriptional regulator [uncultured Clostridium sp.]